MTGASEMSNGLLPDSLSLSVGGAYVYAAALTGDISCELSYSWLE